IPALPDLTRYVIGTLCVLILGSLCFVFFPGFQTQLLSNIWNSIGILIFSGLIVYDVNQAMNSDDQTPVSACQFALGIYLDMLNIFIRLLQVM
ncbi:Bax inhibitor-1 family protein, partial [Shewanella algae]|uniref:Bax inhibitor-1 family protein n=2 Tax=Gammaproteobacteria TaxID=1236 RepID=UPI00313BF8D6